MLLLFVSCLYDISLLVSYCNMHGDTTLHFVYPVGSADCYFHYSSHHRGSASIVHTDMSKEIQLTVHYNDLTSSELLILHFPLHPIKCYLFLDTCFLNSFESFLSQSSLVLPLR